jgi:hypothetical protein
MDMDWDLNARTAISALIVLLIFCVAKLLQPKLSDPAPGRFLSA